MTRAVLFLVFLLGCTAGPQVLLAGFENTHFVRASDVAGVEHVRYEFENASTYKMLNIYALSGAEQAAYYDSWVRSFESIFAESEAPYPGAVTKKIVCPDEFLPVMQGNVSARAYRVFAGSQKTVGVCSKDLVAYSCLMGVLGCEQYLYEFKYCHTSSGESYDFSKLAQNLTCPQTPD
ncbi:hypothetical protein COT72_03600 [archaeon CG10_big_fil_rev_8_21_14_0_10_43_11]|nr:MAG: hypothetical protein COT72_03600 [archaeon CG10_big_fil_rev_8_21_14_0_10_43_11]